MLFRSLNVAIALTVWVLSVATSLDMSAVMTFVDEGANVVYPLFPPPGTPALEVARGAFMLQYTPHQVQVLGLYAWLMLVTPILLWLMARRGTVLLLLLSLAAYLWGRSSGVRLTPSQFQLLGKKRGAPRCADSQDTERLILRGERRNHRGQREALACEGDRFVAPGGINQHRLAAGEDPLRQRVRRRQSRGIKTAHGGDCQRLGLCLSMTRPWVAESRAITRSSTARQALAGAMPGATAWLSSVRKLISCH